MHVTWWKKNFDKNVCTYSVFFFLTFFLYYHQNHEKEQVQIVLPIAELFDMAANPVRQLLNPKSGNADIDFEEENRFDLSGHTKDEKELRPFSLKDLMVLNQRNMLVPKDYDQDQVEVDEENLGNFTKKLVFKFSISRIIIF